MCMRKLAWLLVAGLAMANVVAPGPAQAASETPEQLQTLQGADRKAAIVLARELGETKDKGALDVLLDALALGLHPEVTQVALEAVGMHQAPRSVDVLLAYTKYRDPAVRAQAVSALGRIDEPRATAAWKRALRDQQEVVRSAAAPGRPGPQGRQRHARAPGAPRKGRRGGRRAHWRPGDARYGRGPRGAHWQGARRARGPEPGPRSHAAQRWDPRHSTSISSAPWARSLAPKGSSS